MKKMKIILPMILLLALCSCKTETSANNSNNTSSGASNNVTAFHYEDPGIGENSGTRPVSSDTDNQPAVPSSKTINWENLDIEVLATIDKNGHYVVEAEDCDTSGCTLQAGCAGFFEAPPASIPTSGGECIACIDHPSILAFSFAVKGKCKITFSTVCAKYEDPWNIDENVQYYVDDKTPFVTGYSSFGHTQENEWYNWKAVELGTLSLDENVHTLYVKVNGAFPNTDCFYLDVTDYGI